MLYSGPPEWVRQTQFFRILIFISEPPLLLTHPELNNMITTVIGMEMHNFITTHYTSKYFQNCSKWNPVYTVLAWLYNMTASSFHQVSESCEWVSMSTIHMVLWSLQKWLNRTPSSYVLELKVLNDPYLLNPVFRNSSLLGLAWFWFLSMIQLNIWSLCDIATLTRCFILQLTFHKLGNQLKLHPKGNILPEINRIFTHQRQ